MRKLLKREQGQAAVETIFSIPIFLILFLIGFQLFAITWNSQYAQARSRYDAIHQANHDPCPDGQNGVWITGQQDANVSGDTHMLAHDQTHEITNYSYIVCH